MVGLFDLTGKVVLATGATLANLIPILAMAVVAPALAAPVEQLRPRLIVLTDIGNEPDDSESMVRLLAYANDTSSSKVWWRRPRATAQPIRAAT